MPWLLRSPMHQQAWYWLCRTDNMYWWSRVNFIYLGQAKSKIRFKMWLHLMYIFCNLSNNSACSELMFGLSWSSLIKAGLGQFERDSTLCAVRKQGRDISQTMLHWTRNFRLVSLEVMGNFLLFIFFMIRQINIIPGSFQDIKLHLCHNDPYNILLLGVFFFLFKLLLM